MKKTSKNLHHFFIKGLVQKRQAFACLGLLLLAMLSVSFPIMISATTVNSDLVSSEYKETSVAINPNYYEQNLTPFLEYFEDTSHSLTINEIKSTSESYNLTLLTLSFVDCVFTDFSFWYRFYLKNNTWNFIPIKLPNLLINQFFVTNETLYIYDDEFLHQYQLINE